jgi:rhodanese-related sulfurtransferase
MPAGGARALVDEALRHVRTLSVAEAQALLGRDDVQFVDLRESFELHGGGIPGALHAPRGLVEFWFDPEAPWAQPEFTRRDRRYVLYCAIGWRSALAARSLLEIGVAEVCHVGGGFEAWRAAGAPVAPVDAIE